MTTRTEVYEAIDSERDYQDAKWGVSRQHEIASFLLYMSHHLHLAIAIASTTSDETKALDEIRKVTTLGVVAMEQHGAPHRKVPA